MGRWGREDELFASWSQVSTAENRSNHREFCKLFFKFKPSYVVMERKFREGTTEAM